MPVLVIANRRPKGPCIAAEIDQTALRSALEMIQAVAQQAPPVYEPTEVEPVSEEENV